MLEPIFVGSARREYEALSPTDQSEINAVTRLLELDPWVDNVRKTNLSTPSITLILYEDERWRLLYRVVDERFIEEWAIEPVTV